MEQNQALAITENQNLQVANPVEALKQFAEQQSTGFRPMWYAIRDSGFVAENDTRQEFRGVILAVRKTRRHTIYDPETEQQVPECVLVRTDPDVGQTMDGKMRSCATCPFNKWGTAIRPDGTKGRGKACREKRLILFLPDGFALPVLIAAPPTSIRAVETFRSYMQTIGKPLILSRVRLTVRREQRGGNAWGILQLDYERPLDEAEIAELAAKIEKIKAQVDQWMAASPQDIDVDDLEGAEEAGDVF
ncbi:MAG: hypothetical protein DIU69_04480 [Bacillota bacterium]|nr:MAG: hypothetical protein DIU69_04480 [Bacillota bacterium]